MKLPTVNSRFNENTVLGSLVVTGSSLQEDVGLKVRFKRPTCAIEHETFVIRGVQKDFRGQLVYRVYAESTGDTFGRPAHPDMVELVKE